jgi:hypothetical protein
VESPHNQITDAGQVGTTTVLCNPGDHVLGGGGEVNAGVNPPTVAASGLVLVESYPFNTSGNATGWTVTYRNTDTSGFEEWDAYAICTRNN